MTGSEQTFLKSQSKEIDWEHRRYEIAKEVLPLIIGDTVIDYLDVTEVVKGAVRLSDALIEELKKK
jgi:hypothetical protein